VGSTVRACLCPPHPFPDNFKQRRAFALVTLQRPTLAVPILEECLSFSLDEHDKQQVLFECPVAVRDQIDALFRGN